MEHYYSTKPITKSNEKKINFTIFDHQFTFMTDNSVFSKTKVDLGTEILLKSFDYQKKDKILDIGCGYGPIGIILGYFLKTQVDMIDINERGLALTLKNIETNNVRANVFFSDKYENVRTKYDLIITNPPIRIGKKSVLEILLLAKKHLTINGELWFVIHKNGGAKSFEKRLEKEYNIEIISKCKGFYVFKAQMN